MEIDAGATPPPPPPEATNLLVLRAQLYVEEEPPTSGELAITSAHVQWTPDDGSAAGGVALSYSAVVMHAISRDTSSFPSACIYLQIDAQHKLATSRAASTAAAPTTTPAATLNGAVTGSGDPSEDEDEDEDEDDETPQEVRIVPAAGLVVEGPGDILDRIFEALSKGSELNPDGHEDGSEDDEYDDAGAALLLAASQGMEGFVDTDAMLRGATPAQRAALERYDAMLDTSAMETGVGALPMDIENDDGRFDDAEED
jgi:nucleotide-sensitive chloride channel 1A